MLRLRRFVLLWMMEMFYSEQDSLTDTDKLKMLSTLYERDDFKKYLEHKEWAVAKNAGLKAKDQEELWFMRGRIFQIQSLLKSMESAHKKKIKLGETLYAKEENRGGQKAQKSP